jgi:hypothetical protein
MMNHQAIHRHRTFAIVAAIAIVAWGTAGILDRSDAGSFDPLFEPDYTIQYVPAGGTHALAGFQIGDSVISVEGIPVVELGMYSRWPRSLSRQPGESLTMVVERGGRQVSAEVRVSEPSSGNAKLALGAFVILLAFLGAGLWVLFTVQSAHAVRLAHIGLALGAVVPGPYLGRWDGVAAHFQVAVLVLWTLLLLRFFLLFPKPKRAGQSAVSNALIYGAWGLLLFTLVLELIFHPRFYHTFAPLYGLLMFVYSGLAVAALVHTLVKTSRADLHASGMRIILAGVVIALVPTAIAAIDWMFLWNFDIPGSNWFPLMLGAIPVTMAMAVRRHTRMAEASPG